MSVDGIGAARTIHLTHVHAHEGAGKSKSENNSAHSLGRVIEDEVEISEAANAAVALHVLHSKSEPIDDSEEYEERIAAIGNLLTARFEEEGIDTVGAVELKVDHAGNVRVTSDHPDTDLIEDLFENDFEMADEFRALFGATEFRLAFSATGPSQANHEVGISAAVHSATGSLESLITSTLISGREQFDERVTAFRELLAARFADEGINTSGAIELELGDHGTIRVVGDHPDKAFIETLFKNDPVMSNEFRLLSTTASLLRAVEDYQGTIKALQQDPETERDRFETLFDDLKLNLASFRFDNGILAALFDDDITDGPKEAEAHDDGEEEDVEV